MNFTRVSKLSNLVTNDLKRKPTVILDPNNSNPFRISGTANNISVTIDADEWILPDKIKDYITKLGQSGLNIEERILALYEEICKEYVYDDNVLSYIRKNDDDTFYLPDNYGRRTNSDWKEKRDQHNRRNCFEISRILAKALTELFKSSRCSQNYDVCILWDEAVTHYLVGLACDEYSISLDTDDFTQIKDLTRLKTGLTAEGIRVLDDPNDKFHNALSKFNKGKNSLALQQIEQAVAKHKAPTENNNEYSEDIQFIQNAIQILREDYDLDSAGMFEYLKEIVDMKIGPRSRMKMWKEVEDQSEDKSGVGKRYTRCLLLNLDDVSYIIDVTKENPRDIFRLFNEKDLENPNSGIRPFKGFVRNWEEDPYDGR